MLISIRRVAVLGIVAAGVFACRAPEAWAAAEVHKLSLVLSSNPTQITATDFNDVLQRYNDTVLEPRGLAGIEKIDFGWLHEAELRYFIRSNVTVSAGLGQLKATTKREYLPRIAQSINLEASVLTVPVHVGAAYYLAPYNQGDFQARAYLGGGVLSLVSSKATFIEQEVATDSATTLDPDPNPPQTANFSATGERDSPGFYVEAGAHMFFAVRYSVMLGVMYRSAKISDLVVTEELVDHRTGAVTLVRLPPVDLDMSGIGARLAVAIGF